MKQYIKPLALTLMSVFMSCVRNVNESEEAAIPYYDRADIIYLDSSPWPGTRCWPSSENYLIYNSSDFPKTYIDNADTLSFLYDHLHNVIYESDRQEFYPDAAIIVFLRYMDRTDTLVSSSYLEPVRFNGKELTDSALVTCLVDALCARNSSWRANRKFFY